jgi:hypothetical protein
MLKNLIADIMGKPSPVVNLSPASYDPAFGAGPDASVKAKIINLIASIRTIMRSTFTSLAPSPHPLSRERHLDRKEETPFQNQTGIS